MNGQRTGIVVVSHGSAAQAMVDAAERVLGKLDVRPVSVEIGEPKEAVDRKLEAAVESLRADEILFLVDLEGSTPFNLCCKRCLGRSMVLSGMNMAMLFKLATVDRTLDAEALAEELKATGLKSIHVRPGSTG
jgi:mannose/fructose-specific phosphotransferase system component IIA